MEFSFKLNFMGTVVNWTFRSINEGSIEIM